jgi:hypothetical protein
MAYNDATLDYLDRNIQEERAVVEAGGSRDKLDSLEQSRNQYQQEINVLNEHMEKGESSKLLDRAGVENLVEKLHSLPHYGGRLKDIGMVVDEIQSFEQREKTRDFRGKFHITGKRNKQQDIN